MCLPTFLGQGWGWGEGVCRGWGGQTQQGLWIVVWVSEKLEDLEVRRGKGRGLLGTRKYFGFLFVSGSSGLGN